MELNEIVNIVSGYAFPSSDMQAEGVPILKITNILENGELDLENTIKYSKPIPEKLRKFLLRDKDVLVCMTGATIGKVARKQKVKQDFLINQRVAIIRAKEKLLEDFVYYLLSLPAFRKYVEIVGYGAAQPNISAKSIGKFRFLSVGNFYKCQSIGTILSTYDTLIENNTKRIRLLEKMAENLYKEWFVRFRFPGYEKAEMENGLPKGWAVEKVKDWCRVFTGRKDVNQTVEGGRYAFFSCSPNTFHSDEYIYDGKAILIAGNGSYTGRTRYFEGKFDLYQRTYAVVSDRSDDDFMFYLFLRFKYDFEPLHSGGTRGSAIPYIVMKDITKYKFLYDTDIVKCYTERVKPMFDEIDNLQHQNSLLARRRDLLLPRLMSGKLEVKP